MPLPDFIRDNLLPPIEFDAQDGVTPGPKPGLDSKLLPVPVVGQEYGNWCFAAIAVAVAKFYDGDTVPPTQCAVVSHLKNTACCPAGSNLNVCNVADQAELALDFVGHGDSASVSDGPPDFDTEVVPKINNSQPIVIRVAPGDYTKSGHFVVLSGYDQSSGKKIVTLMNPNPVSKGSVATLDYERLTQIVEGGHTFVTNSYWTR